MRRWIACIAILFVLAPGGLSHVWAADACRPLRTLGAGIVLQVEPFQTSLAPQLTAVLDADLILADEPAIFGLGKARAEVTLQAPVTVRPQPFGAELAGGVAALEFDPQAAGPAVVSRDGRRYLIHLAKGRPMTARGGELQVRPLMAASQAFTLNERAVVKLTDDGRAIVVKGSPVSWQLGDNAAFKFSLVKPTTLEETVGSTVTDAAVTVVNPIRLLPGGVMKVLVRASGYDFRARPLSFCFAVMPEGAHGLYTLSAPGRLMSESTDGALFEVTVPTEMARAIYKSVPGRADEPLGSETDWLGKRATVRVMGLDGDRVVFDAVQPFVTSNFWIAFSSGFVLILVLMLLSAIFLQEPNPRTLLRRLAQHENQRFSLANVQILMWTLLVLYALSFVWIANGLLLDISSGVLVLLGISGVTSVLSRGIENFAGAPKAPVTDEPKFKNLVTNEQGEFDLLRFQMLGFTLFTLCYSFISVIRSEGLPEIPANLYLLMGISNGAYVGGKLADNMKAQDAPDAAVAAGSYERSMTVADIQSIQKILGVTSSGLLDEATRTAIARYKVAEGIVPADGSINELLRARLESDVLG